MIGLYRIIFSQNQNYDHRDIIIVVHQIRLYQRILDLWNASPRGGGSGASDMEVVTYEILRWYWMEEMEPYDAPERFYRLVKQPENDFIVRDDFLPYIKALLNEHPVRSMSNVGHFYSPL